MKYYYSKEKNISENKIKRIEIAYPKVVFLSSFDEIDKKVKQGDTLVFENIFDLDNNEEAEYEQIKNKYQELLNKGIELMFNKSTNCDSEIILSYIDRLAKITNKQEVNEDDLFDIIFEIQYTSWLNILNSNITKRRFAKIISESEGKFVGRPHGSTRDSEQATRTKEIIKNHNKLFGGDLDDKECIKLADVSRNMYYIYKRKLKEEIKENDKNIQ